MAKDVKIPVSVPGAEEAAQKLSRVGESARGIGEKAGQGSRGVDQLNQKVSQSDNVMGRAISSLKGYIMAWLSIEGVIRILNKLIERLERVVTLQKEAYDRTIQLAEVGQRLELQTGTVGRQQQWGAFARQLQQAGGFRDAATAGDMAIALDIATASTGGIKSPANQALARAIAPMFGAAQMGGDQISKFLELAGTAGVAPSASAYQQAFAQVRAGFTASKATDIGSFIEGLQRGGTSFMAQGGTLERAISLYTAARSVTGNEALAGTLLEQMSRLSSGGYEKPRAALEAFTGKPWASLTMDERSAALLEYVSSIPAAQRTQAMAAEGFPVELASGMAKLAGAEGVASLAQATATVTGASPADVARQTKAFMASPLGVSRVTEAAAPVLTESPQDRAIRIAQERLQKATQEAKLATMRGINLPGAGERKEAVLLVLDELWSEAVMAGQLDLAAQILAVKTEIGGPLTGFAYPAGLAEQAVVTFQGALTAGAPVTNFNYYPRTGGDDRGERATMND